MASYLILHGEFEFDPPRKAVVDAYKKGNMTLRPACLLIALATLIATLAMNAHADIVRCTGADGKVSYSDGACPATTTSVQPVRTEMASPGAQLDTYEGLPLYRAYQAVYPQFVRYYASRQTRTVVVNRVVVVRRFEHHQPSQWTTTPHATAPFHATAGRR